MPPGWDGIFSPYLYWIQGQGFPKAKSCLKPAYEPVLLARKPGKKVMPLGIDECRIGTDENRARMNRARSQGSSYIVQREDKFIDPGGSGRWPANICHDGSDEVMEAFAKFGEKKSGGGNKSGRKERGVCYGQYGPPLPDFREIDTGTAARFFYCSKASRADRDEGLEGLPEVKCGLMQDDAYEWQGTDNPQQTPHNTTRRNTHPTVKPTTLMQWLVKLVARQDEAVLDCFMGSGSTGKACALTGRKFIGVEKDSRYFDIACRRIEAAMNEQPLLKEACA